MGPSGRDVQGMVPHTPSLGTHSRGSFLDIEVAGSSRVICWACLHHHRPGEGREKSVHSFVHSFIKEFIEPVTGYCWAIAVKEQTWSLHLGSSLWSGRPTCISELHEHKEAMATRRDRSPPRVSPGASRNGQWSLNKAQEETW